MLPIQGPPNYALGSPLPVGPGSVPPGYPEVDDGIPVTELLGMVRRNWLLITLILAVCVGAAYLVTRFTRPLYRASTSLYFAERENTIPALDILNKIENGKSQVTTEMEVMRSRALAQSVIDSLGLQVSVTEPRGASTSDYLRVVASDPAADAKRFEFRKSGNNSYSVTDLSSGSLVGTAPIGSSYTFGKVTIVLLPAALASSRFEVDVRSREQTLSAMLRRVKVSRPNATASMVQVSYTSHDPVRARDVPDVLAKTYLTWRSTLRKSADRSTVEFLREQIDTIAVQLYAAEESLRRFRQDNQVVDLPTQASTQVQRMANLEAQRADIDMQRASLKSLVRDVKSAPADPRVGSPYRRLMAFPSLMTPANPALPLLQSLTRLEQERSALLVRRTLADPDVAALTQSINDVETQIAAVIDTYVQGLDQQASSLAAEIGQFRGETSQVPRKEVEYARLQRNDVGLTEIYTMLQSRLREAQIAEAVDDGSVRIVDPAAIPNLPIAPRPVVNLLLGALAGLILAFAGVLMRERLDQSVHTKEDVEALSGAAVLALIPHIRANDRARSLTSWARPAPKRISSHSSKNGQSRPENSRLLLNDPQSVASEAFRQLRTNITFARPDSPPRVLVFTSPAPGDGKSTSVMNLAIALVQQGKSVIVIDGDMRRGGLHRLLNTKQSPGLSEVLVGQAQLEGAVQSLSLESFGMVDLISTGVIPPNPAELLASPQFRSLIESLRPSYDAVLIDSPPINLVTDASIIGRETDGAVFVVRAGKSSRGEIARAVSQLRQVQVPVTGIVLNDYDAKRDLRYNAPNYYGQAYDYRPQAG